MELTSFQAEWVHKEGLEGRWLAGVRGVVIEWDVGEVWIGKLEVSHICAVNLELELVVIIEDFEG